ncbi:hypothetical protein [Burkholderia sp. JP2-270]|uniref:hypothetical protein n=1 Tax=Burkholderia sp. JP2-270 TaxID=2217913 RepID=UPI0013A6FF6B|nr:hypothetical protein [Burkholderia sp. JP2-270]
MKKPAFGPVFFFLAVRVVLIAGSVAGGIERKRAAMEAEPDKRAAHAVPGVQAAGVRPVPAPS